MFYSLYFGQIDFNFGQVENQVQLVRQQVRKSIFPHPLDMDVSKKENNICELLFNPLPQSRVLTTLRKEAFENIVGNVENTKKQHSHFCHIVCSIFQAISIILAKSTFRISFSKPFSHWQGSGTIVVRERGNFYQTAGFWRLHY